MTDRITIKLPEGVEYEHPEVQRLLNEIEAVKPLPPELTVREQLAAKLCTAFSIQCRSRPIPLSDETQEMRDGYLAEADAAIAFFRTILTQAHNDNLILVGDPAAVRVHNDAVDQLVNELVKALSK